MAIMLSEGSGLVGLARASVEAYVLGEELPGAGGAPLLSEERGVFVTINLAGNSVDKLRGCIGYPYPVLKLGEAVRSAAIAAASEDPRFPPLVRGDLLEVVFEVSVLTSPTEVGKDSRTELPSRVRLGVDGLIVSSGQGSGLLLPQVATEHGMDGQEFLSQACLKAGLQPDAWKEPSTRVLVFQAEAFAETEPRGEVARV